MVSAESRLCIRDFETFFISKFPIIHRVEGGSVLAKVATTLSLLHNVTWFSQRKVAPLLTCEECEAQTCNLILNLNFLAVAAGSHWRKYTSTTSQISSGWAAARWEEEGQRVRGSNKSGTHVIETSGGPKDSLNIACPLSVSHCISISFTGEQDLQPIQWHLVLTLADNTQHHLVMEWCRGQGWSWSCGGDSVGGCPDIQALATLSPLAGTLAPALRPHHQHTLAPSHTRPLCSASSPSPLILHWALFQAGPIFDIPSWYPGFTPNQT